MVCLFLIRFGVLGYTSPKKLRGPCILSVRASMEEESIDHVRDNAPGGSHGGSMSKPAVISYISSVIDLLNERDIGKLRWQK
jgi:hypothetical protein